MMFSNFGAEPDVLQRVTVRLIAEHEDTEFERLLTGNHYLHAPLLTS